MEFCLDMRCFSMSKNKPLHFLSISERKCRMSSEDMGIYEFAEIITVLLRYNKLIDEILQMIAHNVRIML